MRVPADVLILGGGAAGLAAAAALGARGARVRVLERQSRAGKKLLATGNGRCNLSNADMRPEYYGEAADFVRRLYEAVPPERVLSFFSALGLMTVREEGRVYPRTMQAASVLDVLRAGCARENVRVVTDCEAVSLAPSRHGGWIVRTAVGASERAPFVLAAMGGAAAPHLGTDGSGARLLRAAGHTVTPLYPALVQLRCEHPALRGLKGIRARAALTLLVDGREAAREEGELLFADYGVSGVCVLQLSRLAAPALGDGRDVRLLVDLLPELGGDALRWLDGRVGAMPGANAGRLLTGALPRMLAQAALREASVPWETPGDRLTDGQRGALAAALTRFPLRVCGTRGFSDAQVTRGGVARDEVDPATMASKRLDGLYIAGELLDVDGPCGGYNLHFAFAGALAASDAISSALGL